MFKSLIQTDENGIVQTNFLNVEPNNYTTDSFSYSKDPVMIDNDLSELYYTRQRTEDGVVIDDRIRINPYTEQVISGKFYGGFELNEQVYQSSVPVEVANYQMLNGITATSFQPIVSTIGVSGSLGQRAAKFFGTYSDLPLGKGAGLKLPPIDSKEFSFLMVEGFLYLESLPTAYDPIIISRGYENVGGTTQDSFLVEYDVSSGRLMLNYTLEKGVNGSTAAGYANYLNMSPPNGVTTDKWHHFAFSVAVGITSGWMPGDTGSGFVVGVGTFFDGARQGYFETVYYDQDGATADNGPYVPLATAINTTVRNSNAPLMIGCGASGGRPFKGWLDSVLISGGRSPTALRGYYPDLSSITLPAKNTMAVGEFTVYHLNMKGPLGSSFFPCDTPNRVTSSASYISNEEGKMGVALVSRQLSNIGVSALGGITLFTGVCYGHSSSNGSVPPCFGMKTGSCIVVSDVEQLHGLTKARRIRSNAAEFTISYLLGSTGMRGFIGASGDFPRFFTRNWGGNTFSYLATQTNTTQLKFAYDSIMISGRTGIFYVRDYFSNTVYGVQTADIKNLYGDVVEYHSLGVRLGVSASSRIEGVTSMKSMYEQKCFEQEAIVRRVAPRIENVGILYISNYGRMTKTTSYPELINDPYVTKGVHQIPFTGIAGSFAPWYPNLYTEPY